ncbi:hypothetical protein HNQ35_000211 [Cerasibacillus quisquiliarum]|uniref:Uncharacterized protein n=1 Tax=Cerasibacillus quisquiliarum TaxID=227865 RepID=A0A511UU05_9BACI|nr:hypothetical protein [Cerasibacillus quisquiliarum]MBB5145022.1 hypothetical protein [Cerasibacillus quisquiliarum]GEN30086.1 hypothetical protein CQU01_03240 [Cerasibacillus quisquiliarum]
MQKGFWPFIWISFIFILLISPFFMLGWMLNDVSDSIEDIGKKLVMVMKTVKLSHM